MRRFIAVMLVNALLLSAFSGCGKDAEFESSTFTTQLQTEKETESVTETTTKEKTEPPKTEEETTEKPIEYIKCGKIKIDDGKYKYTIEKKAFEDNYSEDFLMGLMPFLEMGFGYADYDNWNGETNSVLNDLKFDGNIYFDSFEYNSPEWKKAVAEMDKNPYDKEHEYGFTTVDRINEGIKERFGPGSREFKAEDFDTYNEIKTSDTSVFENYDLFYRFAYLPESDCVVYWVREVTSFVSVSVFICNVQTVGNYHVVETVVGSEDFYENGSTFEGHQTDALKMFNSYTYGRLFKNIFTIAFDKNNNMYMKSVEKSYIIPENVTPNYRVVQDDVAVEAQKYYSSEWETVDTLSKGEEIYSGTIYWLYEDYVWVSTEKYEGRVERKYLVPIE
ncbi:MAG: hypothetical protein IKW12_05485 [Clostridia bacterium]|nr:hypothetical protein [Clostridia bacterium]